MSKTILITGASTGFGRDTAETLARAGHHVFASMRDPEGKNRPHSDALRKQGSGLVITIGSILGRVTFPFFGIYGASKFAVEALTDSLRYEVSQLGIEVALVQPSAYPTPMYSNVQQPADTARAASYGAVGEIPGAMFKHFISTFEAANAPNPHDVAEAIARLVDQPKGSRPARTVVGTAFGSDTVNQQTAPVQAHVVEALGLGHLAKVA